MIKRLRRGTIAATRATVRAGARGAAFARHVAADTDTYVFGGIALVAGGVGFMISIPLAAIVTGAMLIALGVWMTWPAREHPGGEGPEA